MVFNPFKKPHKYKAVVFEYEGRKYASTAQAERAMVLDGWKRDSVILNWFPEVTFRLGPDHVYRVDALVVVQDSDIFPRGCYAEDVKGFETAKFRRIKTLWRKYMDIPLLVIKKGDVSERILGGGQGV